MAQYSPPLAAVTTNVRRPMNATSSAAIRALKSLYIGLDRPLPHVATPIANLAVFLLDRVLIAKIHPASFSSDGAEQRSLLHGYIVTTSRLHAKLTYDFPLDRICDARGRRSLRLGHSIVAVNRNL